MMRNNSRIKWENFQRSMKRRNRQILYIPEIVEFFEPFKERWTNHKTLTFKEIQEICQSDELQKKLEKYVPKRSTLMGRMITADIGLFLSINFQLVHCPVLIEGQKTPQSRIDNIDYRAVKISVFIDGKWKDLRPELYSLANSLMLVPPGNSSNRYKKYFLWQVGKEHKAEEWLRKIFWIPDEKRMTVKTAEEVETENQNWRFEKYYLKAPPEKAPKNEEEELALTRKIYGMRPLPRR